MNQLDEEQKNRYINDVLYQDISLFFPMSSRNSLRKSRLRTNKILFNTINIENSIDILWDKIDALQKTATSIQTMLLKSEIKYKKQKIKLQIEAKLQPDEEDSSKPLLLSEDFGDILNLEDFEKITSKKD